jgi:hypothetical protein
VRGAAPARRIQIRLSYTLRIWQVWQMSILTRAYPDTRPAKGRLYVGKTPRQEHRRRIFRMFGK